MTIVVDDNIIAALVLPVPYSSQALRVVTAWHEAGDRLIAPILFEYEIATVVRRAAVLGHLTVSQVSAVLQRLLNFNVITIAPDKALHLEAIQLAGRIGHGKAYDAQYLALAAREDAPFWTADRRLATAGRQAGLTWIHWIGEDV